MEAYATLCVAGSASAIHTVIRQQIGRRLLESKLADLCRDRDAALSALLTACPQEDRMPFTLALARTHGLAAHSESDLGEPVFKHR